jgi:hypothetical protein
MTSAARRNRTRTKYLPARWIDVAADDATVHTIVAEVMVRGYYSQTGEVTAGVAIFEHGTQTREFWFDVLNADLILQLMGRPGGWGRVVAFTEPIAAGPTPAEPAPSGTRVTISLTDGLPHRNHVRRLIAEVIEAVGQRGILIGTSEPFTGIDLPQDSPGQPYPKRTKPAENA